MNGTWAEGCAEWGGQAPAGTVRAEPSTWDPRQEASGQGLPAPSSFTLSLTGIRVSQASVCWALPPPSQPHSNRPW